MAIATLALALGMTTRASAIVTFLLNDNTHSGADSEVSCTVAQDGVNLRFTLAVIADNTGNVGDLRGLFFDVADESLLPLLSATGPDITAQRYSANDVAAVGRININPLGPFDVGLELGASGIGHGDDIQAATFTLSADGRDLDVDTFFRAPQSDTDWTMGARVGSVGPAGSSRNESSKVAGWQNPDWSIESAAVPEPLSAVLVLAGLGSLGAVTRRRRRQLSAAAPPRPRSRRVPTPA